MNGVNRRAFLAALALPSLQLEAIVAARVPHVLTIPRWGRCSQIAPGRLFELRSYRTHLVPLATLLARHGLEPVWSGPTSPGYAFLIPFDTMAGRAAAWSAFAADQEWIRLRQQRQSEVTGIALYRSM